MHLKPDMVYHPSFLKSKNSLHSLGHAFILFFRCFVVNPTKLALQQQLYRVAKKPGNLEFDNLGKKNLEKPGI